MVGEQLRQYRIDSQLGAGGMGVVYRAHDTLLNRTVAIKVIRPEVASDPTMVAAFTREAKLCSSLSHPGIVAIHETGEIDGRPFFVMEYLDGKTLKDVIPSDGFALPRALELAIEIGEALEAAHAADVVHRDMKPGNVFLCDSGVAKILDFGLARLDRNATGQDTQTASLFDGKMVGSIAYMAPEQARTETVDHRADIFSFGVIVSQMVTGELPFEGPNPVALLRMMQLSPPIPIRQRKPQAPGSLEAIVLRALEKDRANRFASMGDMLRLLRGLRVEMQDPSSAPANHAVVERTQDLPAAAAVHPVAQHASSPPATGSERTSIAVLPFRSESSDPEDGYLASGLASEVIRALTGVPSLRVAPQQASFALSESDAYPSSIGRRLNTRYVVAGTLRRAGERLRVTVMLADSMAERVIWSRNYDRRMADIFEVQDDMSRAIVSSLGGQLIKASTDVVFPLSTDSLDAWGLVRKAYHIWNYQFSPAGVRQALSMLRRALELDPRYALANAYLGLYLVQTVLHGISQNPEADAASAMAAAERASALAPNDPEVLECCVIVWLQTSHFQRAVQCGRRAVQIAPFDLVAWGYLSLALGTAGNERDVQEAHEILSKLIADAPDHPSLPYWLQFMTSVHIRKEEYPSAVDTGRRCVEMQPGYALQQMLLGEALWQTGQREEARAVVGSIPAYNPLFTLEHYLRVLGGICVSPQIVHQFTKGLKAMHAPPPDT